VLTQAADALLKALLRERAGLGIVQGPAVQWGAENGSDDEHIGSIFGMGPHLRAKSRISACLVCDEENPLKLRERLVNHHSSIPCGTATIAAIAPACIGLT
jgi:hypothetical protein